MSDSQSPGDAEATVRRRRFLTVREAADELRVGPATIYRAIHEGGFPAVRIRGRYVVPTRAVEGLAEDAYELGRCVDVADYTLSARGRVGRAP